MIAIRNERLSDAAARETLLDRAYGPARFAKTSARLREGRLPAEGLSFVATEGGKLIGTVRLWNVWAGPARPALLLGPLAVDPAQRKRGIGAALIRHALAAARKLGHRAVLLVGDAPYYGRFGFSADKTGALWMPGPCEPTRLLALELQSGALAGARGPISASGARLPRPDLAVPVAAARKPVHRRSRRAA
jgi:predicted N-acetyltransferase YhbS